jgi:hypothetical protein
MTSTLRLQEFDLYKNKQHFLPFLDCSVVFCFVLLRRSFLRLYKIVLLWLVQYVLKRYTHTLTHATLEMRVFFIKYNNDDAPQKADLPRVVCAPPRQQSRHRKQCRITFPIKCDFSGILQRSLCAIIPLFPIAPPPSFSNSPRDY